MTAQSENPEQSSLNIPIRCFGDAVLFTPTEKVNFQSKTKLQQTIQKMMITLSQQGGVGIAANQCANIPAPVPSIIIVGFADPALLLKAQARYPNMEIPKAEVLINPLIIERSTETYYPQTGEGCLSVPCSFRGRVNRHRWVIVRYQDIEGQLFEGQFTDMRSHIVQHEVDHIQGVVFLHRILHDMDTLQRQEFAALIDEVLLAGPIAEDQAELGPRVGADRDEQGNVLLQADIIKKTLSDLDKTVLLAIRHAAIRATPLK